MRACKPLPYGQLTTALAPTIQSPCFLRQSATVAKVRETFLCLVCPYPLRDRSTLSLQTMYLTNYDAERDK